MTHLSSLESNVYILATYTDDLCLTLSFVSLYLNREEPDRYTSALFAKGKKRKSTRLIALLAPVCVVKQTEDKKTTPFSPIDSEKKTLWGLHYHNSTGSPWANS